MDVTLLRKLTEKSKLKFGKYQDLTVGEVLNLQHPNYIRWAYYNCDMISFMDDVLEKVRIPEEYRITKPGKNPELGEELNDKIWGRMHGLSKHINSKKRLKERKASLVGYCKREGLQYSKVSLQGSNHGKSFLK